MKKPTNTLIAGALILALTGLLTGCATKNDQLSVRPAAQTQKPALPAESRELIQKAAAVKKDVRLAFSREDKGGQIEITVSLENPSQKPLTSVQSWLAFDPAKLKGVSVRTADSAFPLAAPYANTFDNESGLVMIGRSSGEPVTATSARVATVVFTVTEQGPTALEAYDYREDLDGHTSANMLLDGEPFNVLLKPDSPAFVAE